MVQLDEQLLERLNTLIVEVDKRGMISHVGSSVKRILGYDAYELIGTEWWTFTMEDESGPKQGSPIAEIKRLLRNISYSEYGFERKVRTASGDLKWIQWNISKNPDGSIIGLGRDITRRKQSEEQVKLANIEIRKKHREILDSIEYAGKLQTSMLPDYGFLKRFFESAFVLYKPKDIVAGDFYWLESYAPPKVGATDSEGMGYTKAGATDDEHRNTEKIVFFAAADCTGHGVPGAMVSVVCQNALNEVVKDKKIVDPARILDEVNKIVEQTFNSSEFLVRDGMDISLCAFYPNETGGTLKWAGANNPLWIFRPVGNNLPKDETFDSGFEFIEIKPDKQPIGGYEEIKPFTNHEINLLKGDKLFIFSDGYADQFGGERNKKLNRTRFKEILQFTAGLENQEQEGYLNYVHQNWKQKEEQTDDILVIGITV